MVGPRSSLLTSRSALDTHARVGDGIQSDFGNPRPALLAGAVSAVFDTVQRGLDHRQGALFILHEMKGEFLLEVVAADVRHMDGHAGEVTVGLAAALVQCRVGHLGDVSAEPGPQGQQTLPVIVQFRLLQ